MHNYSGRQRTVAFAATLALALAPLAWSHEAHGNRVMGTVTAIHKDMNHVEVKAKDGHVTGFKFDDKTKYMRGTTAATLDDVKVGDRVVATVTGEGDAKTATVVKLSKGTATAKTAAKDKADAKAPAMSPEPGSHKD